MNSRRIISIVASCLAAFTAICAIVYQQMDQKLPSVVSIGDSKMAVEVAATKRAQETGLKNRHQLADNTGMIFVFRPNREHINFWMEGTQIPLDLIFVHDGKVEKIYEQIQPPDPSAKILQRYGADAVSEAIEVNAGFVKSHHIAVGDPVALDLHYNPMLFEDYSDRLSKKLKVLTFSIRSKL